MSVPHPSSTQGQQDCADGHAPGRAGTVVEGLGPMSRPLLSPPTPPAVDSVFMQGLLTVPREQSQAQEYDRHLGGRVHVGVCESQMASPRGPGVPSDFLSLQKSGT